MGKVEEEQQLPTSVGANNGTEQNVVNNCSRFKGFVKFRCVVALLFGAAVLISALFLLPFFHTGDLGDLDLDPKFRGHDIVASFMLEKPTSFIEDHILQLEDDIFGEIGVSDTRVEIISLDNIVGSNITKVAFAVDSNVEKTRISPTSLSLVRSELQRVITHQTFLRLSPALFGDPFSFDVLKLTGGVTVSPKQSGFLMQNEQIRFNFTLNFSIDEIQDKFDELTSQLKSGVHLASYENLYIKLTNRRGSTVDPPTIIQCKIFPAVGINPSPSRAKQLAQTIGSNSKNLGLNNTVFGRVKQVSLSSTLQRPLGGNGGSPSPSPAPQPYHRHHHHHHHHHHHEDPNLGPAISPAPRAKKGGYVKVSPKSAPVPAPVPVPVPVPVLAPIHATHKGHAAPPPCHLGRYPRKANRHSHPNVPPVQAPIPTPHIAPAPTPSIPNKIPISSPLPSVVYAHTQPPPTTTPSVAEPPHRIPSGSRLPSSPSTGIFSSNMWALLLFLLLVPRH